MRDQTLGPLGILNEQLVRYDVNQLTAAERYLRRMVAVSDGDDIISVGGDTIGGHTIVGKNHYGLTFYPPDHPDSKMPMSMVEKFDPKAHVLRDGMGKRVSLWDQDRIYGDLGPIFVTYVDTNSAGKVFVSSKGADATRIGTIGPADFARIHAGHIDRLLRTQRITLTREDPLRVVLVAPKAVGPGMKAVGPGNSNLAHQVAESLEGPEGRPVVVYAFQGDVRLVHVDNTETRTTIATDGSIFRIFKPDRVNLPT